MTEYCENCLYSSECPEDGILRCWEDHIWEEDTDHVEALDSCEKWEAKNETS